MTSRLGTSIEILKDKLIWTVHDENFNIQNLPRSSNTTPFFLDKSIIYTAFFADFGPFDLGLMYKFCQQLHDTMLKAKDSRKCVVFYTSDHPHVRANSAALICAYMIFVLNATVEQAYTPFIGMTPQFTPFRDAGFCINTFPVNVLDCAYAMRRAKVLGHFNYKTFSLHTFQNLAKLQNGDISWIIPGKFIAFSGPITKRRVVSPGVYTLTPEEYVPVFKGLGVTCVVRFNSKCYDRNVFLSNGIRHVDLFYEDGGNPTDAILQAFLQICEHEKGAIAVHCKAGLGRTGTNIAAYMMKHYGYTTKESIAWCRLCRPGSVVGPQQQYLATIEPKMVVEGELYRERHNKPPLININAPQSVSTEQTYAHRKTSSNSNSNSNNNYDGRVMTPPIYSNPRDNSGLAQRQPVEPLFQRSGVNKQAESSNGLNGLHSSSDDQFSKSTNNLKAYSTSLSQQQQQQQQGSRGVVNGLTQQTQLLSITPPPQSTSGHDHNSYLIRPSTSSGIAAKKSDLNSSGNFGNGLSSPNGNHPTFSRLSSASPQRVRMQNGTTAVGSSIDYTSTPVKTSGGYFGNALSSAGNTAFQTPPPRQQQGSSHYFDMQNSQQPQQQRSPSGQSTTTDGKLIIALSPTATTAASATSKRPSTSHQHISNGNSSPVSTSKLYASSNTSNPTRRSVSVNRSVNFAIPVSSADNAGDLDYKYSSSPSRHGVSGTTAATSSGGGNNSKLSSSQEYERHPKPSSPSLQYQLQQQQYNGSLNAAVASGTSHVRLSSANNHSKGASSSSPYSTNGNISRPRTSGGGTNAYSGSGGTTSMRI